MTPEAFAGMMSLLNMAVSLLTLLGVAYALGQVMARFDAVEKAIFGGDQQQGVFMRRTEAELLIRKNDEDHDEFTRRIEKVELRRLGTGGS